MHFTKVRRFAVSRLNNDGTRRERLKLALYLKLKKRKVFKPVKGGRFGLFENPVCCKISNKMKGEGGILWRQKNSKKVAESRKKLVEKVYG